MSNEYQLDQIKREFAELAMKEYGTTTLKKSQIKELASKHGMRVPPKTFVEENKVRHGVFALEGGSVVRTTTTVTEADGSQNTRVEVSKHELIHSDAPKGYYVPKKNSAFVGTNYFKTVRRIIQSRKFFPTYVTGLSGLGKTETIIQACATSGRELIRVNFTEETSERHLIGGFRISGGDTVWEDGPVLVAMKRGAVLLLDEVDLSTPRVLCLQSILEGSSYINKQTNEVVEPTAGFQIFATGNTKGRVRGADSKFVGVRSQNEAFMDRFDMTIQQDFPTEEIEFNILLNYWKKENSSDPSQEQKLMLVALTKWSAQIRESYIRNTTEELISTRRLKSVLKAYFIFGNIKRAIEYVTERFDADTKAAFLKFFSAIYNATDETNIPVSDEEAEVQQ